MFNTQRIYKLIAIPFALSCAGTLTGCVGQTVAGAAKGGGSTISTRTLTFVDAPSYDVGTVAAGSTTLIRLSISTTGTGDATISSTSNSDSNFTFNGGTFPGAGGTCVQPIQGNCSVAVLFTAPASTGVFSDVVSIAYDNGNGSGSISLPISANVTAAAVLTINGGATYAYGTKNVSTSTDVTLTVANAGGLLASAMSFSGLSAPIDFKGGSFPGTGGTCGITLGSLATCNVVLTYAPVSAGTTNRTFSVSYNNGTSTVSSSISVTGTAQTLALLSITAPAASPYDYGNVVIGAPGVDLTVTVTNSGGQIATALAGSGLSAPMNYKGGSYPGTGGSCGATLPASSTCNIIVTFTPTASVTTNETFTLTYADGSGGSPTATKALRGTGKTPASLAISDGATYDYLAHPIGTTTSKTFTVTNSGETAATAFSGSALAAPYSYAGGSYPGTAGTCAASLAAAATCTVVVNYTPSAAVVSNATLTLPYNNGISGVSATRPITGTGLTVAALTLNGGATYPYGSKSIGSSTDATLTIANSGGSGATAIALSGLSAPLDFKGGVYPGTGGTCAATLAAGSSCTIVINYAPLVAGATSQTLLVNYNNGASATSTSQLVTGTALALASLTVTAPASSPYDYGNVTIGATGVDVTVTLSNGGGQSATSLVGSGLGAPINYKGGSYPGTGGTCGATLAAAATCNIIVTFTPTTAVTSNITLTVTYADGSGGTPNVTKPLRGTGLTPAVLTISGSPTYDYTTRPIGTTTSGTFTVTNSGGSTATGLTGNALAAPYAYAGGAFPGTAGTCAATLAPAGTCTVVVNYAPTAAVVSNATLTLPYNDGASATTATRPMTGTGAAVASITLNGGANYGYGSKNVGSSTDATLTVANGGTTGATALVFSGLSAPLTFKGGSFPGTGGTCGATLAGSASCTVVVTYAPTAAGATSQTLLINYNNGATGTSTSQLVTGTGVALASLSVTAPASDPFDYGTVTIGAAGVDQPFTISNGGGQAATSLTATGLAAPFNFKGGSYPGTGGTCGASLANGSTCTIIATFLPTTPGVDTDSLDITYNDGSGSTIHLPRGVTGTGGTAADLSISDGPSYDFGSRTVSTTTNYTFTITNIGGSTATGIAGTALTAPFTYKGGGAYPGTGGTCGTSLAAGVTCTVNLSFTPSSTGGFSDTLTLTYNNAVSAGITSARPITGTGGSAANLSISDGPTYNYGSIVKGYTVTKTFTISNLGGVAATAMSGAALGAPYSYFGGAYPGTGGTCGTTLGAAGTCTVLIKYAPTAVVTSNSTFTLNYNNSLVGTSSARAITGTGATISKINGGTGHTCAMYSSGAVKCWGSGSFGQLGNGSTSASTTPVAVSGINSATDLASGANHSCALLSNGRIYCWGADNSGQLGDNAALTNSSTPVQVGLYTDFTQVSAGGDSTCGLRSGGTIVCWGNDLEGTVGDNAAFVNQPTPVTVSGLAGMTDVSVGRAHACGRKSDNTVRCWGAGVSGQLGNAANANSGIPVTPAPGTATATAAGGDVACTFISGGTVKCQGDDTYGQLGDNAALASKNVPTAVGGLTNASSIKIGLKHGCALTAANAIVCWGRDNSGQLGDNAALTNQGTPVTVSGMASSSVVGVGENHSCGVLATGLVYCWGEDTASQLGDGGTTNQPTPVLVQGL